MTDGSMTKSNEASPNTRRDVLCCGACGHSLRLRSQRAGEDIMDLWCECTHCDAEGEAVEAPMVNDMTKGMAISAFWDAHGLQCGDTFYPPEVTRG